VRFSTNFGGVLILFGESLNPQKSFLCTKNWYFAMFSYIASDISFLSSSKVTSMFCFLVEVAMRISSYLCIQIEGIYFR
jgi:hypothetical protein